MRISPVQPRDGVRCLKGKNVIVTTMGGPPANHSRKLWGQFVPKAREYVCGHSPRTALLIKYKVHFLVDIPVVQLSNKGSH